MTPPSLWDFVLFVAIVLAIGVSRYFGSCVRGRISHASGWDSSRVSAFANH